MTYNKKLDMIENYIRSGETRTEEFRLGVEMEHFVIWKDSLKSVSYYGKDGVEEILRELLPNGWSGTYEGEHLLGLRKGSVIITLEPGSQLEVSIDAAEKIEVLEKGYLSFLEEIHPLLEKRGQGLVTLGYHPVTKIEDIKLLPKKRYDLMFDYFKTKGSHAHNMMKGTGAFQVAIDYSDEEDYHKKFRTLNALAPVFYAMFENALFFEGKPCKTHNLRAYVWMNCDNDRAGIVENALSEDFSYRDYGSYILERPPIFTVRNGEIFPTGEKKVKEILEPGKTETKELEHLMTMFFPDIRTKTYLEVRMMDSIPYPLNFSAVALIKGLFYNDDNLDELYHSIKGITADQVQQTKVEMLYKGLDATLNGRTLLETAQWLLKLAYEGLNKDEKDYLDPLKKLLEEGKNPYLLTRERFEGGDRAFAIDWAIYK
ncbi:glutamate--cysteine ligase [Gudongella sp. DL1XJH-153]|uniref:glutamate--cysteine ligase n=1 Tax=Gudongella sp. DL1XJH-153 TaxID=3409804 RepID=UPI003BB78130